MTPERFNELLTKELLPQCYKILNTKGMAYSGGEDKLGNFKRGEILSGVSPIIVWFIYFLKHFDALSSYIKEEYKDSEPINGRIIDMINYLFLLYALLEERKHDFGS